LARREARGEAADRRAVDVLGAEAVTRLEELNGTGDAMIEITPRLRVGLRPVVGVVNASMLLERHVLPEDHDHREGSGRWLGRPDDGEPKDR
jgi:hypothetical protein